MANTCNCLKDIPIKVLAYRKATGAKNEERAKVTPAAFFFDGDSQTMSELKITVTGRKSPVTVTLTHSFCPFCGTSYKEQKEVANG